jgi:uncharacterized protein YbcI
MASPDQERVSRGTVAARISTGAVQLFARYTGRGPTRAHAWFIGDMAVIVMRDTLTEGEQRLAQAGKAEEVLRTRRAYQDLLGPELTALVEENLGRKVVAFVGSDHVDPDVAVEFFLLEPFSRNGASADGESPDT